MTLTTCATLFSGGEGAGVGLQAAGLRHCWGVEYDPAIAAVAQRNGFDVMVADVRAVDYTTLAPVDWLHASPVCTRASNANPNATESPEDIETAAAVVRAIDAIRPQVFTLENVWGYRDFTAFKNICAALGRHGYFWDFEHVNSADFAVPQTRRRLILRASRGLLPHLPPPVRWVGWYEAIEDLIPTLPESKLAPWQMARLPKELRETVLVGVNGHNEGIGQLSPDSPSQTVTAMWNTLQVRAVLVDSKNANQEFGKLYRDLEEPALTVITDGKESHQPRAVLLKGDDNSGDYGVVTCAQGEPAFTLRAGRSTEHRAMLICKTADKFGDGQRQSFEQAQTIGANEHGSKGVLWSQAARVVSMTPRALARFQSVPDTYILPDKRTLAAKVIGNMVPPLLMQRIAENMMEANP
jgi:DNA (cytosine-5)-methyltransferase 1